VEKILVVDDEKDVLVLLKDFFQARSYEVVTASNGKDALKTFDAESPDIILCDIKMPVMDGFEFLKELRTTRKWTPVIMISALNEHLNVMKAYEFEADYYISKPLNLETTLRAVQIMSSLKALRVKK